MLMHGKPCLITIMNVTSEGILLCQASISAYFADKVNKFMIFFFFFMPTNATECTVKILQIFKPEKMLILT